MSVRLSAEEPGPSLLVAVVEYLRWAYQRRIEICPRKFAFITMK